MAQSPAFGPEDATNGNASMATSNRLPVDPATQVREWRDNTGNYRITGTLKSDKPEGVVLVKEQDGQSIIVPYHRFSVRDKIYLNLVHDNQEYSRDRMQALGTEIVNAELSGQSGPPWRRWALLLLPVLGIICGVTILVQAFRRHILWGLATLFIPFVYFIFVLVNVRESGKYLFYQVLCFGAAAYLVTLELPQTLSFLQQLIEVSGELGMLKRA